MCNGTAAPETHGMVQGSLLWPVLYLLYTNDFAAYISDAEVIMYADDVQFLHSNSRENTDTLKAARVASTLDEAHSWFVENSIKINPTKTEVVLFMTCQRPLADFSVRLNDMVVRSSPSAKVLGIVIDENLPREPQVSLLVKRCYATLHGLSKLFCGLSTELKVF